MLSICNQPCSPSLVISTRFIILLQIYAGFLINLYLTVMMNNNASFKKQNCESTIRCVWIHFCMVCKGDKENSISFSGECKSLHVGGTHKRKNFVCLCMHTVSFILACLTIMLLCAALNLEDNQRYA